MSLHHIVKLEKLIAYVLPLSCYRKKLRNFFHLSCVLQIRQIWIQFITTWGKYCKTRVTDLELSTTPLTCGCRNDDMIHLGPCAAFLVASVRSDQWCVFYLYTFSCNSHKLWSTGFKSGKFGYHSWGV